MAYSKALVLICIWNLGSKCLRIGASIKVFRKCIKAFLALEGRKSILEELIFAKSDFLGLVNFGFLDFANFVAVDRFLILPQTSSQLASTPAPFDVFCLFFFG